MEGDIFMNVKKYDLVLLILSIFLQNFALITTKKFGIAFSTCFLIYLFFKYKIYKKISLKLFIIGIIFYIFLLLNSIINNNLNLNQILRLSMIIFDSWTSYQFIKTLSNDDKEYFIQQFKYIFIVWCIYGIYEYFAQTFKLPQFLNIFSNNPSYGAREIYAAYSGWSSTARIYTTFFEPSVYSIFIVYSYFFIIQNSDINKESKKDSIILIALFIINLILTFARSGYMCAIYITLIIYLTKVFKQNKKILKALKPIIIMIPFITFAIMLIVGTTVFKDESMKSRTYSSLYYFTDSLSNAKNIIVGNGIGSLKGADKNIVFKGIEVENFAHNGYIEIIYQFGYIFFSLVVYSLYKFIEKMDSNKKWMVYGCIFTVCISGAIYNVESIIILLSIICSFAIKKENVVEVI